MSGILFPSRAKADFFEDNKERKREIPNMFYVPIGLNWSSSEVVLSTV